ncbi:MAG: heavy-metal-associated domain-containing protein [Gammaproteobacteria bacterium]
MLRISTRFFITGFVSLPAALLLLAVASLPAHADGLLTVRQTIFGMDCAPCAYGIQKGVLALPGVKQATVNLNTGVATIMLKPDSPTTLAQIRKVILDHGFTPKEAVVTLSGELEQNAGRYYLMAAGTRYPLTAAKPGILSTLKPGEHVVVEGQAVTAQDKNLLITVTHVNKFPPAPVSTPQA